MIVDAFGEEEARMDYTVALSVWAVSVAAPCVISWLAGDMVGSARTRRAMESDWLTDREAFAPPQAGVHGGAASQGTPLEGTPLQGAVTGSEREDWRVEELGPRAVPSVLAPMARPQEEMSFEEQARQAERRRERREAFARMPALSDLRAHADAVRRAESPLRTLGKETRRPDEETMRFGQVSARSAQRGLTHFENSVRELQRTNSSVRIGAIRPASQAGLG